MTNYRSYKHFHYSCNNIFDQHQYYYYQSLLFPLFPLKMEPFSAKTFYFVYIYISIVFTLPRTNNKSKVVLFYFSQVINYYCIPFCRLSINLVSLFCISLVSRFCFSSPLEKSWHDTLFYWHSFKIVNRDLFTGFFTREPVLFVRAIYVDTNASKACSHHQHTQSGFLKSK